MLKIDEGHQQLTALSRTYGELRLADANEAETRLKVIDEVLFRVLGWDKSDVQIEQRVTEDGATEYADYTISTAATQIVVEAKRVGAAFALPHKRYRLKLGGVLAEGDVGLAIRQARDYCRKLSIPFACVTNGAAWIVFPAVRTDAVSFEDSEAYIFRSLEDVRGRFIEFWELLSRERVLDGNLENELLGRAARTEQQRTLRMQFREPGYRLGRNALYDHIEPAVTLALSDEKLLDDPEALKACYVKTSERLKYDSRIAMHLRDSLPQIGHKTIRVRGRKGAGVVDEALSRPKSAVLRFIVLLGSVGAGKTTFLHYTRKVSAAAAMNKRVVWLLVDFKRSSPKDNIRTFIFRELLELIDSDEEFSLGDWESVVSKAYEPLIRSLRRGPLYLLSKADKPAFDKAVADAIYKEREKVEPYVERILQHAAAAWPAYLVIDNVDQLEDSELQAQIFLEAQALARRVGCHVIMSLRETTYQKHRERPQFDAFQFESYYIDPPNVLPVLSHRFAYAKRVLSGRGVKLVAERGIGVNVPDLGEFFDLVSHSLLSGDTGYMIECLAGSNIRRGLSVVREFLASGHTNADRAIASYLVDGRYRFPKHEVFRGAILGPFRYYSESTSLLLNVFDSKLNSMAVQLLRLQIVSVAARRASVAGSGELQVLDLQSVLGRVGVTESDLLVVLNALCDRHLLHTIDGQPVVASSAVFPTRLAGYTLKVLSSELAYVEACLIDTVVHEEDMFSCLGEITAEIESESEAGERLRLREERVGYFLEYLSRCEKRWIVEARRRDLPEEWTVAIVEGEVAAPLKANAAAARRSAERRTVPESNAGRPTETGEAWQGEIVDSRVDKDYVFIRDEFNVDWFAHRSNFLSTAEWDARRRGARCAFLHGQWQGRPRAVSVRVIERLG